MMTFWAVDMASAKWSCPPVHTRIGIDVDMQARKATCSADNHRFGPRRTNRQSGDRPGTSCRARAAERLRIWAERGGPRLVDVDGRCAADVRGQRRPLVRDALQPARPHPYRPGPRPRSLNDGIGAAAAARPRRRGAAALAAVIVCSAWILRPASRGRHGHGRHGHDWFPHDLGRVPDGDAPVADAMERNGVCAHFRDVGGDDDRHDDAVCRPHDPHLCTCRKGWPLGRRHPLPPPAGLSPRDSLVLDRLALAATAAIVARTLSPCSIRRGKRQQRPWRRRADRAGLYQWTPLKNACLSQCQSPLIFIARHGGFAERCGSAATGGEHGLYASAAAGPDGILFVGGMMNVAWIAALSGSRSTEKSPAGWLVTCIAGAC